MSGETCANAWGSACSRTRTRSTGVKSAPPIVPVARPEAARTVKLSADWPVVRSHQRFASGYAPILKPVYVKPRSCVAPRPGKQMLEIDVSFMRSAMGRPVICARTFSTSSPLNIESAMLQPAPAANISFATSTYVLAAPTEKLSASDAVGQHTHTGTSPARGQQR